jgi:tetratricopeptide (TPR) repeat protein
LRTLPGDLADAVARRLVAASIEEDPARAYAYAQAARKLAARVGIVRETSGIAAYRAGEWADALTELRAARRLTGRDSYLPLMADSERALGRLDRALDLVTGPQAQGLDRATTIELRIVESGIRRDQGLPDAAVVALQVPELTDGRIRPGSARLFYAYADALLDAGREDEARDWFARADAADSEGVTDAADRLEELDPVIFEDLDEDLDDDDVDDELDDSGEAGEADDALDDTHLDDTDLDEDVLPGDDVAAAGSDDGDPGDGGSDDGDPGDGGSVDGDPGDAVDGGSVDGDPGDGGSEDGDPGDGGPAAGEPGEPRDM